MSLMCPSCRQPLDAKWLSEYTAGQSFELYSVPMSASFFSKLFPVAVNICYLQFSVCLIGVQTLRSIRPGRKKRNRYGVGNRMVGSIDFVE